MKIRSVRLRDIRVIREMEKTIFGRHAFPMSALMWSAVSHANEFFVADSGGGLLGYLIGRRCVEEPKCWEIASVAVKEERRNQGVGTRLIEEFVDFARGKGARKVALEVSVLNPRAQALYRRMGFAANKIIPSYYGLGEDGIKMVLDLAGRKGGSDR